MFEEKKKIFLHCANVCFYHIGSVDIVYSRSLLCCYVWLLLIYGCFFPFFFFTPPPLSPSTVTNPGVENDNLYSKLLVFASPYDSERILFKSKVALKN